jgi:hypothetical protein
MARLGEFLLIREKALPQRQKNVTTLRAMTFF